MSYKLELKNSMNLLASNENVVFIGYGLGESTNKGGGFLSDIPESKIIETPVAENLMLAMAIGMSLEGYIPVVIYERFDFIMNAMDALVNHLDKIKLISCNEYNPKVIIRCIVGGRQKPFFSGPTHTQDFTEAIQKMVSIPVIKLKSSKEILSTYTTALESDISTIIVEEKDLYDTA